MLEPSMAVAEVELVLKSGTQKTQRTNVQSLLTIWAQGTLVSVYPRALYIVWDGSLSPETGSMHRDEEYCFFLLVPHPQALLKPGLASFHERVELSVHSRV